MKKSGKRKYLLPCLAFVLLVLLWEISVRLSGCSKAVMPGPVAVFFSMWELIETGALLKHSIASLFRVTSGFYLAILLGIPSGVILGWWKPAKMLFNPLLRFLRPISPLAWIPLAMLWFGIGDMPAIFLIFLASFFPIVFSTTVAVEGIKPTSFQVASNFNFSRFEVVSKIILPAIMPSTISALRISLGVAWLVVVAAEMIGVKSGLGYLIIDARNGLRMDYVIDAMILIGVIGLFLDSIMKRVAMLEVFSWGLFSR